MEIPLTVLEVKDGDSTDSIGSEGWRFLASLGMTGFLWIQYGLGGGKPKLTAA